MATLTESASVGLDFLRLRRTTRCVLLVKIVIAFRIELGIIELDVTPSTSLAILTWCACLLVFLWLPQITQVTLTYRNWHL